MKSMECKQGRILVVTVCLILPLLSFSTFAAAQNMDCSIILPPNPLTAQGLATPFQLTATNPADGACNESNSSQSAFVQAAIFDPATGQISVYNPLVIDAGTQPAVAPVVPTLPANAVVALWFGYNGNNLTQQAPDTAPTTLADNKCVNGISGSVFGQFSYCNAVAFFRAANRAIAQGQLKVPALGMGSDGAPCPTVRSFTIVDQDQSDNLPVTYLMTTSDGTFAQNTSTNASALTATKFGNPSDNGLLDRFVDPALGCTPWKGPDLADPGHTVPALALNELQAAQYQQSPVALIPAGDPMVLDPNGNRNLAKLNLYRAGVNQRRVEEFEDASTAAYCRQMMRIQPAALMQRQTQLTSASSPVADIGNNLFTFMAARLVASYQILGCDKFGVSNPVSVATDVNGVATGATITLPTSTGPWSRFR
jgi:hypothetical protein